MIIGQFLKDPKDLDTKQWNIKNMTQKLIKLKGEIENSTIIYEAIGRSVIDRPSRHKVSKDTAELISTIYRLDIIDIHGVLPPIITNDTFFSSSQRTLTRETTF